MTSPWDPDLPSRDRIVVADPRPTRETAPVHARDTVSRLCALVIRHFEARDRCDVAEERATREEMVDLARGAALPTPESAERTWDISEAAMRLILATPCDICRGPAVYETSGDRLRCEEHKPSGGYWELRDLDARKKILALLTGGR